MVTIELRPKDPQEDYLKQKEEQVQKPEKGGKIPITPQFKVKSCLLKKKKKAWLQEGWFERR